MSRFWFKDIDVCKNGKKIHRLRFRLSAWTDDRNDPYFKDKLSWNLSKDGYLITLVDYVKRDHDLSVMFLAGTDLKGIDQWINAQAIEDFFKLDHHYGKKDLTFEFGRLRENNGINPW